MPLVEYAVNYAYVSEVLCINKNKPESNCHGKCYLGKEIANEMNDNAPQNKSLASNLKIEVLFINNENIIIKNPFPILNKNKNIFLYKEKLHNLNLQKNIENPPQRAI